MAQDQEPRRFHNVEITGPFWERHPVSGRVAQLQAVSSFALESLVSQISPRFRTQLLGLSQRVSPTAADYDSGLWTAARDGCHSLRELWRQPMVAAPVMNAFLRDAGVSAPRRPPTGRAPWSESSVPGRLSGRGHFGPALIFEHGGRGVVHAPLAAQPRLQELPAVHAAERQLLSRARALLRVGALPRHVQCWQRRRRLEAALEDAAIHAARVGLARRKLEARSARAKLRRWPAVGRLRQRPKDLGPFVWEERPVASPAHSSCDCMWCQGTTNEIPQQLRAREARVALAARLAGLNVFQRVEPRGPRLPGLEDVPCRYVHRGRAHAAWLVRR
eukprot:CAMPEP_0206172080 /NCGR_PEP_ID=MMETSP1474-20131121/44574_1 /ASSEMBLY_ACC=CAM_ASM_001110 /TAXON_ID=97495 /ORGANISM="Imantonia sp., Strain RCC918" /LENGTH=331 /DNA_ID=CAMNT_0053580011 /DNA_START=176 /DNA_END=1168 /DNA_ORIENTATION=+